MVYEIFDYYYNQLGIIHYIKWKVKLAFWAFTILIILLMLYLIFSKSLWYIFLFFIPFIVLLFGLNWQYKMVLKNQYNISSTFWWNQIEYFAIKKNNFYQYLASKNLVETKLLFLIELVEKRAKEAKTPSYIYKFFIGAILTPVWVAFIHWIYNNMVYDIQGATIALVFATGLFFFIIYMFFLGLPIYNDLFNDDYKKLKILADVISDYYLKNYPNNIS